MLSMQKPLKTFINSWIYEKLLKVFIPQQGIDFIYKINRFYLWYKFYLIVSNRYKSQE